MPSLLRQLPLLLLVAIAVQLTTAAPAQRQARTVVELSPRATAVSTPSDLLDGIVAELRAEFNETSTSKNRTLSSKAVAINPKGASYYSALVAVGASYTDNAHARADGYRSSLREYYPYNKWDGRYTNGKVAVEWMVDSATSPALKRSGSTLPKLLDYAYGGSVVKNGLSGTSSSSPAAVDQISQYLSDVKAGSASLGAGRVLHYFNSGINSQFQIWNAALSAGLSDSSIAAAKSATFAQVSAMGAAIRTIATDSALASKARGIDFLIVGIPPLEIVPTSAFQIPASFSATKKTQALALLKTITAQYNAGLADFATKLKSEVSGRVFHYELSALWYDLHKNPKTYGISTSPVSTTCYNSKTGSLCSNPSSYLYLDTLHPVTSIHALMSKKMNALVLGV